MVFSKHKVSCSNCGRTHEVFFPSEKFKIEVRDWSKKGIVKNEYYCDRECLKKALK